MQQRALTLSLAGLATALTAAATLALSSGEVPSSAAAQTLVAPRAAVQAAEAQAQAQVDAAPALTPKYAAAPTTGQASMKGGGTALLTGTTTASYFWDDGSGVNGDTGAPASGKAMQEGLFASPSWPLGTRVRVSCNGRTAVGFVGDRGPGAPSHEGIMLDLDTHTFRYLLDGREPESDYVSGTGEGHLQGVRWEVLEWGDGAGVRGEPQPYGA